MSTLRRELRRLILVSDVPLQCEDELRFLETLLTSGGATVCLPDFDLLIAQLFSKSLHFLSASYWESA
jgi:hypothetical protein